MNEQNIWGISFKDNGKVYYFSGNELELKKNDYVIVETEKGMQYGKIVNKITTKEANELNNLKNIIRIATDDDYNIYLKNLKDADKALKNGQKIADSLCLKMKFIDASFTFDRKQLLLNFLAEERIDFRELAKKLAGIYRTRIELRQIGARDKAREISGLGVCGRELCCYKFLNKIDSITMNMAKNQNIALNPTKINGACGRLLCCLTYEDDEYLLCRRGLPEFGQNVKTKFGSGHVVNIDILNRKYDVLVNNEKYTVELNDECPRNNYKKDNYRL